MTDARPILAVVDAKTAPAVVAAARRQAERRGAKLEVLGVVEPPREIILYAVIVRAGLVIKAPEPFTGPAARLFASTDQHLLRKCPCPVWLIPEGRAGEVRTVVAAVDVDPEAAEPETLADVNARVIQAAYAVCEPDGEIHLLHAWQAEDEGLFRAFGGDGERAAQAYADAVKAGRRGNLDTLAAAHPPPQPGPRVIKRLMRGPAHTVIAEAARRVRAGRSLSK